MALYDCITMSHCVVTILIPRVIFLDWFDEDGNPNEDYPDRLADVIVNHFEGDLEEVISTDEYSD